jgi:hypothetical protein
MGVFRHQTGQHAPERERERERKRGRNQSSVVVVMVKMVHNGRTGAMVVIAQRK